MTDDTGSRATQGRNTLFRSLANEKRRIVLGRLLARSPSAVSVDELVDHLAAVTADGDEVGDEERRRAKVAFHHDVRPALTDAGLVTFGEAEETIALSDAPQFDDDVIAILSDRERVTDESISAVFAALADRRRRLVCSKLRRTSHAIDVETLARSVAAVEEERPARAISSDRVDDVAVSLVHAHLPKLAEAGLVAFDDGEGRASYLGHPDLRVEWMESTTDSVPVRVA